MKSGACSDNFELSDDVRERDRVPERVPDVSSARARSLTDELLGQIAIERCTGNRAVPAAVDPGSQERLRESAIVAIANGAATRRVCPPSRILVPNCGRERGRDGVKDGLAAAGPGECREESDRQLVAARVGVVVRPEVFDRRVPTTRQTR